MTTIKILFLPLTFVIVFTVTGSSQPASTLDSTEGKHSRRDGLWFSIGAGDGFIEQTSNNRSEKRKGHFELAFQGGYTFSTWLLVGAELRAWWYENYNTQDPTKGENINQLSAIVQVYPLPNIGFYMNGGVGLSSYTNLHVGEYGGGGHSIVVGAGYDIPVNDDDAVSIFFNYSRGVFDDVEIIVLNPSHRSLAKNTLSPLPHDRQYNIIDIGVAFTFL